MSKLIILQGPPASGKTTWVKNYLDSLSKEDREKTVVVSRDEIRKATGTYWVPSREGYITELEDTAMKSALQKGFDVINDVTNLNPETLTHLQEIAKEYGVHYECVPLYVPFKEALARDEKRRNEGWLAVGEKVLLRFYQRYFPDRLSDELFTDHRYVRAYENQKEDAVICDLDGTIALHTSGRTPFEYERCDEDTPCWPMVKTIRRLADGGAKIIFVSGREDIGNCKEKTTVWLNSKVMEFRPYDLILRKKGDHRPGHVFKHDVWLDQITPKYNIIHVFDDSTKCVKMYRSLGLQCSQAFDFDMNLDNDYEKSE